MNRNKGVRGGISLILVFFFFSCASFSGKRSADFIADRDPIHLGSLKFELDNFLGSDVVQKDLEVEFHPRTNEVSLRYRYETIAYTLYIGQNGRRLFTEGFRKYKKEYEAKTLVDRASKTRVVYGKGKERLNWGVVKLTEKKGHPVVQFGYLFKKAPYFTITQGQTRDEFFGSSGDTVTDARRMTLYFTRAQAEILADWFDQGMLLGLLGPLAEEPDPPSSSVSDEY
ncbi:MAG: hypothetical protein LBP23_03195 [Treponema sp.]|jgi:hypothetical protein|nr:hypothetical protein [Treponema sp.]